ELDAMNLRRDLGLEITYNEYKIIENQKLLQKATDWFFEKLHIELKVPQEQRDLKREIEYFNGVKLAIPNWYLIYKGHDLEVKLKKSFVALEKYRNEGDLQKKLSIISAKSYPFIHLDTVNMIIKIINGS